MKNQRLVRTPRAFLIMMTFEEECHCCTGELRVHNSGG